MGLTAFWKQNAVFSIYKKMLQFDQDNIAAELILTLTEFVTIHTPYYLFVFTNVTTKAVVTMIKAEIDDESNYPQRYNKFTIDASLVFAGQLSGEWHYIVYQQSSPINTNPEATDGALEYGKLILNRATEFSYTMYEQAQTYKAYNG
jgi:hypothetical protein